MQEYKDAKEQMEMAIEHAEEGNFLLAKSTLDNAAESLDTVLVEQKLM